MLPCQSCNTACTYLLNTNLRWMFLALKPGQWWATWKRGQELFPSWDRHSGFYFFMIFCVDSGCYVLYAITHAFSFCKFFLPHLSGIEAHSLVFLTNYFDTTDISKILFHGKIVSFRWFVCFGYLSQVPSVNMLHRLSRRGCLKYNLVHLHLLIIT